MRTTSSRYAKRTLTPFTSSSTSSTSLLLLLPPPQPAAMRCLSMQHSSLRTAIRRSRRRPTSQPPTLPSPTQIDLSLPSLLAHRSIPPPHPPLPLTRPILPILPQQQLRQRAYALPKPWRPPPSMHRRICAHRPTAPSSVSRALLPPHPPPAAPAVLMLWQLSRPAGRRAWTSRKRNGVRSRSTVAPAPSAQRQACNPCSRPPRLQAQPRVRLLTHPHPPLLLLLLRRRRQDLVCHPCSSRPLRRPPIPVSPCRRSAICSMPPHPVMRRSCAQRQQRHRPALHPSWALDRFRPRDRKRSRSISMDRLPTLTARAILPRWAMRRLTDLCAAAVEAWSID